jgi:hypothetical protein
MELLAYAAAFYLWQCLAFLPEGAVVFRAPLRRFRVLAGEGARLLHPWPSAATLIGARLPIALEGEAVRSLVPSRRFGARASGELSVADLRSAAVSGCTITVAGKPFLRAATAEHASALGRLLRSMGGDPQASPHAVLLRFVRRSLSLARLRRDFAAADRATRWLGFGADVYAVLIFFVLPLLLVFVSPDAALLRVGPLIGVVHVVTVATLYLAHSRLYPAAPASSFWFPPLWSRPCCCAAVRICCAPPPPTITPPPWPRSCSMRRRSRTFYAASWQGSIVRLPPRRNERPRRRAWSKPSARRFSTWRRNAVWPAS